MGIFNDFITIILAATLVVLLFARFRIPSLIGFLFTGMLIGPTGFALIKLEHELELMAEVGVMLLMFNIGLEFSIERIKKMKFEVLVLGTLQIIVTMLGVFLLALFLSFSLQQSFLLAMVVSMSSTAIVLKTLQDKQQLRSPSGRLMVGILLFQDICIVPFLIITPMLGKASQFEVLPIMIKLAYAVGLIILVFTLAKYVLPKIIDVVFSARVNELFMTFSLGLCFGLALLTYKAGFSLAMGSFIAGMILAETIYHHQIESDVKPLKNVFLSIFFISVGMLLNLDFVRLNFSSVFLLTLSIIAFKALIIIVLLFLFKQPKNIAFRTGITISQIGEFSFMLLNMAKPISLISEESYQLFLSAIVFSMLLSPLLFFFGEKLVVVKNLQANASSKEDIINGEVLIVGYGINGINLSRIFKSLKISYKIIEINPTTVKAYKAKGEAIYFGDSTSIANLNSLGIKHAKMMVIAISDSEATAKTVEIGHKLNPDLYIIVRSEYISQIEPLYKMGANVVISQEFEASLEITSHVLKYFGIAEPLVRIKSDIIRKKRYGFFNEANSNDSLKIADLAEINELNDTYFIHKNSTMVGSSISSIFEEMTKAINVSVIGVIRNKSIITDFSMGFIIEPLDTLIIFGTQKELENAINYFENIDFRTT